MLFPVDERLHGTHEVVVADDEQLARFLDGRVSRNCCLVVDVTAFIHGLELGIQDESVAAAFNDVAGVIANLVHAQHEVVIDSQHLRHGVVLERRNHHVLASHVTMDVRLVEFDKLGREEGVMLIGLAVGIRHVLGVDAAREVAFRRGDFHVIVVGVFGSDDLDAHQSFVADDGRDGDHRNLRVASGSNADRLGDGDDAGLALRRGDLRGKKS